MKNLILLVLLLAVLSGAYWLGGSAYQRMSVYQAEISQIDGVQNQVKDIKEQRNKILSRLNSIGQADIDRMNLLLPIGINDEELYVFFQDTVKRFNLNFLGMTEARNDAGQNTIIMPGYAKKTISFEIKVSGTYAAIRQLVDDLENSIRLMDVTGMVLTVDNETQIFTGNIKGRLYYVGKL